MPSSCFETRLYSFGPCCPEFLACEISSNPQSLNKGTSATWRATEFEQSHASLKFGREFRAPTMQARLTRLQLMFREIFEEAIAFLSKEMSNSHP
jgi:hypothetical protein